MKVCPPKKRHIRSRIKQADAKSKMDAAGVEHLWTVSELTVSRYRMG